VECLDLAGSGFFTDLHALAVISRLNSVEVNGSQTSCIFLLVQLIM